MTDERSQFEQAYRAEFDYVWNSLRRFGIPERDLNDVCHDVFMVVYRKWDDYDPDRPLRPWLYGIAFRVASDYKKKASNARETLSDPAPPSRPPSVYDKMSKERARDLVMEALQHVELDRRAVFVMAELDGYAVPEVADALSIPVKTAYSRIRLAREEFKQAVDALVDEEARVD